MERPDVWKHAVVATVVVAVVHLLVPWSSATAAVPFTVVGVAAAGAVAWGLRHHRPAERAPWYALGAAPAVVAGVNLLYVLERTQVVDVPDAVTLVGYLAMYPLMTLGVLGLTRARQPGGDLASLIDALLVAGVAAVVVWVVVWAPGLAALELTAFERALTLTYPLLDLLLLTVTLRLVVAGGDRPPAFRFAVAAILLLLGGDVVFSALGLAGDYVAGDPVDAAYLAALGLLAVTALHPSMVALTRPTTTATGYGYRRLATMAMVALLVPTLQATAPLHGRGLPTVAAGLVTIGLGGLVIARMALLLADLERSSRTIADLQRKRAEARFAALVAQSTDVVFLTDAVGTVRHLTPAARRTLGVEPDDAVGRTLVDVLGAVEADDVHRVVDRLASRADDDVVVTELRVGDRDAPRYLELSGINRLREPAVEGLVITARDLTDRKHAEERLRVQAVTDPLTGLANRVLFHDRLEHALARHVRAGAIAVLFLDLDDFKTVNDSLGHAAGDDLLKIVAERLAAIVRPADTLARLGGDEFACLLEDLDDPTDVRDVVERIQAALADPVAIADRFVRIDASIGIATSTGSATSAADLLRDADTAMYTAKTAGKGTSRLFAPQMHDEALRRLELKAAMRQGLESGQFRLVYQPIVDLETGHPVSAEALVRWRHPTRGQVAPLEFIPLAEETGFIVPLGRWILQEACRDAATWTAVGLADLRVSVNVSARQLTVDGFVDDVAHALAASGLPAGRLQLELTESVLADDTDGIGATLRELKRLGVAIAVDDFGTGYSSLSYLRDFPIDVLKLDRSFVSRAGTDDGGFTSGVLTFANHLALETVAEGIEDEAQLDGLRALSCQLGQGYLFARPAEAADFAAWLAAQRVGTPSGA